jgi:hypothetical protein
MTTKWAIMRDGVIVAFQNTKKAADEYVRIRSRSGLSRFNYTTKKVEVKK